MSKIFADFMDNSVSRRKYFLAYTVLFLLSLVVACRLFFQSGKGFICTTDGFPQHYTALLYFGRFLRNIARSIVHQHKLVIPMYNINMGFGSDILTTLNYYVIGDPLNLLSAVVPARYTEYLYDFLVVLRLYLCGLTFSIFCMSRDKNRMATLVGSVAYVFVGYTFFASFRHPFFTNPLIYLPLLLVGCDRILERKKPTLFIGMLFLSAISNFYFLYLLVIAVIAYVAVRFFSEKHEAFGRELVQAFAKFMLFGLTGILMAGVILVPVFFVFFGGMRGSVSVLHRTFYSENYYRGLAATLIWPYCSGLWTRVGVSAPVVFALPALFLQRRQKTGMKIAVVAMIVMLCIPEFGSVLNGFSYVCNRWSMFVSALFVYIFVDQWERILNPDRALKIAWMICGGVYLIYYVRLVVLKININKEDHFLTPAIMFAVCLLFFLFQQLKKRELRTLGILCLTVIGIGVNGWGAFREYSKTFLDFGTAYKTIHSMGVYQAKKWIGGDSDFYRIGISGGLSRKNLSILAEENTTLFYWSLTNGGVADYLRRMEYQSWKDYNYTLDGTRIYLDAPASVKYAYLKKDKNIYGYEKTKHNKKGNFYVNSNALPFGYTYSGYVPQTELDSLDGVACQQAMLQNVVLEQAAAAGLDGRFAKGFCEDFSERLDCEVEAGDGIERRENGDFVVKKIGASVKLSFRAPGGRELYFRVSGMDTTPTSEERNWSESETTHTMNLKCGKVKEKFVYYSPYNIHTGNQKDFLVNMGYYEDEVTDMTLSFPHLGTYHFDSLEVISLPVDDYQKQIQARREEVMENPVFSANRITGTIALKENKFLCMSIPYDKGWTAYVDGEKTELLRANIMYMALPLSAGNHTIELHYHTYGLGAGAAVSLFGFVLFFFIIQIARRKCSAT